jgi:CHASE3 domain sensor protein
MDRLKWPHVPVPNWVGVLIICFFSGWNLFVGYEVYESRAVDQYQILAMQTRVISEQALSDLRDAESGQRGFLFTGDERYLKQYFDGSIGVRGHVRTLREYIGSSPRVTAAFDRISPLIDRKLNELENTLAIYKRSGPVAAQRAVMTNEGLNLMSQIKDMFDTMRARQRDEIRHRGIGIF